MSEPDPMKPIPGDLPQLDEDAMQRFVDENPPPAEPMEERLRRELRIRVVELADQFDSRDHEIQMGGTGVQDDCMDLRAWARSDAATPLAQARSDLAASEAAREEERAKIAAFFQEALDQTEEMEMPHAYRMLRVKVLSRISALTEHPSEDG